MLKRGQDRRSAAPFARAAERPDRHSGESPRQGTEAFSVANVSKRFGSVEALDSVTMSVGHGEVVALVGDNGAGKSTLVKIISGVVAPDKGELRVQGQPAVIRSPNEAAALGIHTVHQDFSLADNLDVVENLFLGRELRRGVGVFRRLDFASMRHHTRAALSQLGITTISNIGSPVVRLSGGQRQTVSVARATLKHYPAILLDEPTTGLGVAECQRVVDLVLRLRARGAAVLIVSQNIEEAFAVADRIVVLHLGKVAAAFRRADATPEAVVGAIMGVHLTDSGSKDQGDGGPRNGQQLGAVAEPEAVRSPTLVPEGAVPAGEALRVVNVGKAFGRVQALDQVSMSVQHGEVVALLGDNGAGKSTLVKIISGVTPCDEGELYVDRKRVAIRSPSDAAAQGIRTIHQDLALSDNLDVTENLFLGRELSRGVGPWRRLDYAAMRHRTESVLSDLGIGTIGDIGAPVAQLSGGQRQTIAVARATLDNCRILLLDEPTASLGLREARHALDLVVRLRQQGTAVVIISHNIRQVFDIADRIVVLHLGRVAAVFRKADATPETVVKAIMGRAS